MAGKKKQRQSTASRREAPSGSSNPPWVLIGGLLAVAAVAGVMVFSGSTSPAGDPGNELAQAEEPPEIERPFVATRPSSPKPPADAPLPALPLVPNLIPRAPEVISAAYEFAAYNPDILEYVPCFCGCETAGHTGNASCFVQSRNPDGTVREWDNHGMSCMVCVDVAQAAQQLHASGASVEDIREAIEAQYSTAPRMTPTPAPPSE